ncbi:MAG TPA: carboxylating nicotinate-nucleotide diphosphorylase [Candidatus Eremiobacteraceae bacterium]|nr:carboxylating nicotinate-nucleotide diphosphorylase [Candidatus Eremiobacteraceae bacterium]
MADVGTRKGGHPFLASEPFVPMDVATAASFDDLINIALAEDVGDGDITSRLVVEPDLRWGGRIVARTPGVVAGLGIAARVFTLVDPSTKVVLIVHDGSAVDGARVLATLEGEARSLLTAERVALNFLGRLSGIATLTHRYVDATAGTSTKITDTRKTTPGLRALERYAVRAGGGVNHRFGLADAVLIKDNHIAAVGSVKFAVKRARAGIAPGTVIEVECDRLEQVADAVEAGADSVLLDNMDTETMRRAVELARGRAIVEASGGMTVERVAETAATGVDVISIGALTHSAPALDVALDFDMGRR